jgi:dGTPase
MNRRERIERSEDERLAPYASKSSKSLGRTLHGDEHDDFRTCFQRDRDRILYTKSFKDLQYKTQVFVISEGDFYRTRLTHTLEVAQHARTLARSLNLNEDLCEAISFAHDLGHTPFGHIGEETIHGLIKDRGGFEHNLQSLRIVDLLEKRYPGYDGLNLTYETREGIACHTTTYDHPQIPAEFRRFRKPSLEAQIVNIADPLAYCAHDLEDALNARYLRLENVTEQGNPLVDRIVAKCHEKYEAFRISDESIQACLFVRTLIEETNAMVLRQTESNIKKYGIKTEQAVRESDSDVVSAPGEDWSHFTKLKAYLLEHVYRSPQVCIMNEKGKYILTRLFRHLEQRPEMLPKSFKRRYDGAPSHDGRLQVIVDYISGMTDRYAMDLYQMMFEPYEKVMFGFRE